MDKPDLKAIRKEKGLKQRELADLAKVTKASVSAAERGILTGGPMLVAILKALGLNKFDITRFHCGSMNQSDLEEMLESRVA